MITGQYPEQSFAFVNPKITSVPKDSLNATSSQARSSIYSDTRLINIKRNFLIPYPRKARVLQPFFIKVRSIEDGFLATSDISDVYELGETSSQAVRNYLYSLADEVIWFQEHQESLSPSLLKDFDKLQSHIYIC